VSGTWRLLADDGAGAAEGLALDEALMRGYGQGRPGCAPTLRLYSYRDHCALVGRYQNLEAEVDLAACRGAGAEVNRRLSGGGAIVMGAGQLGVAYLDRARPAERPREVIEGLAAALVAGLAQLGIVASFQGKNDLEVGGRKIAGLGMYVDPAGAMLFHASVLADLDVQLMLRLLRVPAAKLDGRAVAAVSERVTTVSAETGGRHDAVTLRPFVARGFETTFGITLQPAEPDPAEAHLAEELAASRYCSQSWLDDRSAQADASGSALLKTPAGLARIYLATHGDLVKSAVVAGDFNDLPPAVAAMESGLRWRRLDRKVVIGIVKGSGAADALGVAPERLADAVIEAGMQAGDRAGDNAAPAGAS